MARSRSGYSGYHGRRTLHDLLKRIAAVLAVLVALLLAGLFFGQEYIVYTDGGLRLDLPFLAPEETPLPDPGDVSVVIRSQESQSEEPAEPIPEEEPPMLARELPVEAVLDGTALQKLEEAGANALVLEMKDREGMLNWVSEQTGPYMEQVNAKPQGINESLVQWNQGDVYTVARVCCFRDNTVPYYQKSMAIRSSEGNWRDELGLRWMNPASEEARNYLAALCGELAGLGFDEILLEDWAFPAVGNLGAITWGEEPDRVRAEEEFLAQVEQALAPYGAKLSVRVEEDALTGESGGQTAGLLEKYARRIWLAAEGAGLSPIEEWTAAGISSPEERLVVLESTLDGSKQQDQAVLERL